LLENLHVLTSLDYVGCGTPIVLPGTYSEDPNNSKNFFWQHQTRMYYQLLKQQFDPEQ
jgi:hypothetical protein